MKSFYEYMNEGVPAGWQPTPRMSNQTFKSVIMKIAANIPRMPFNGNFTDMEVIKINFGLDDEEFQTLKKSHLMVRGKYGWNIDRDGFMKAKNQMGIKTKDELSPTPISPPTDIHGRPHQTTTGWPKGTESWAES